MHKAFILLVHFQPRPPRVPREGGRMEEKERDFTFVLLRKGKCKKQGQASVLRSPDTLNLL